MLIGCQSGCHMTLIIKKNKYLCRMTHVHTGGGSVLNMKSLIPSIAQQKE